MRAVNLLPAPRAEKRDDAAAQRRSAKLIAVAGGAMLILVAVLAGVAFTQARSDVSARESTLHGTKAELASIHAKAAVSTAVLSKTQAHLVAVTDAATGRIQWDGLLDQLSRVMPKGAWLETLQATGVAPTPAVSTAASTPATPAPAAAPTGFVVTGHALSQETVAQALERLALMPALSEVTLQSSARADVAEKKAFTFTIGANVRSAGGN